MKTKVGVLLSGCGVQDGSEIHEAVLTLLALDEAGAEAICIAPNKSQSLVVNHVTGKPTDETRNCLIESARIARGKIRDLASVEADELDAVILPGGFGAALNLCDFGKKGSDCSVDPDVTKLLGSLHQQGKPIGAICIAPATVAAAIGKIGPTLTIGDDVKSAREIEKLGGQHVNCPVDRHIVDQENRIVTSPAYMLAESIKELRTGIELVVKDVLLLAKSNSHVSAR